LAEEPQVTSPAPDDWPRSYFNYFTEVEERFRQARGTGLFLLSPLDWALIETWKNSGVPLEAVLTGIDVAFEKWRSRERRRQAINSIAYCTQAVMKEAEALASGDINKGSAAPFPIEELRDFLDSNRRHLESKAHPPFVAVAQSLADILRDLETHFADLEDLERRLTVLEEKLLAAAQSLLSDEDLVRIRRDLDSQLSPYRSKMTVEQLALVERKFIDRRIFEEAGLRRLSLFYIGA
jgi:hypothetical protein